MGAKRVSKQGVTVSEGNAIEVTNTAGTALFSVNSTGNINALANLTAKGSILTASAANTPTTLAVGTNEHRLVANSATTSGLAYVADTTNYAINAKGDLLVGTAADTVTNLAVASTAGWVLTVDSATTSGLKWAAAGTAYSGTRIRMNANLTVNNATNTTISWPTEDFDTDSYHSTSSNTSRITIPSGKAGKFWIYATVLWDSASRADAIVVRLYKNGTEIYRQQENKDTGLYKSLSIGTTMDLAVNDYLEILVYQDSGTTLTVNSDAVYSWFGVNYLGA